MADIINGSKVKGAEIFIGEQKNKPEMALGERSPTRKIHGSNLSLQMKKPREKLYQSTFQMSRMFPTCRCPPSAAGAQGLFVAGRTAGLMLYYTGDWLWWPLQPYLAVLLISLVKTAAAA